MRYVYAVTAGLAISIGIAVWWMTSSVAHVSSTDATPVTFVVAPGQQLRSVAYELQRQGFISSAGAWTLYTMTQGLRSSIFADTFVLRHTMSGRDILRTLTTNPLKENEVRVTIVEGLTLSEIADQLERANVVNGQEFLNLVQHPATSGFDASAYRIAGKKPSTVDFEGYVFPDTYNFFKHSEPSVVLGKMLQNLDLKYSVELEQATVAAGYTPHEVLTMASILEKELTTDTDRALGADLFWRRIAIGMPMQSDATVNYVTGKSSLQPTISDTETNSPYNTYTNKGLPPGPIDNPSLSSLRAAIYPKTNTFLYYLHAPDGTAHFAITYEEHLRNKALYLK